MQKDTVALPIFAYKSSLVLPVYFCPQWKEGTDSRGKLSSRKEEMCVGGDRGANTSLVGRMSPAPCGREPQPLSNLAVSPELTAAANITD